jgi:hypothetical protein
VTGRLGRGRARQPASTFGAAPANRPSGSPIARIAPSLNASFSEAVPGLLAPEPAVRTGAVIG